MNSLGVTKKLLYKGQCCLFITWLIFLNFDWFFLKSMHALSSLSTCQKFSLLIIVSEQTLWV